ncbi:maltooligosyl trehalose synthase [Candidatus Koribacter versatilis Ellin345]|uniref:Maltooligosyl trehalose synthase n=1 Tax=Koribacter versatilis (strain Ellin345) TaxID=204669 RepID=Q1IMY6_KORVE|nr:malto-oligosyltrehalose synthase [Candidatus Koribacter versatilis]ABF41764.1 maltooligosyl trehalose synthase [Candidatus Koribacter versatilis Ellin345]
MRSSPTIFAEQKSALAECMERIAAGKRQLRPTSTYRLQFHSNFRFTDAEQLIGYLHELGISHCYASPILKARAGSTHGYDITDHNSLNPEIGTEEEFHQLSTKLKEHGIGFILDVVPNHMGVGTGENRWWQDVLENGRASEFADYFDIDWNPLKPELRNKLLLPILGNYYGDELEAARIKLSLHDGLIVFLYYERVLPVDPQTIPMIYGALGDLRQRQGHRMPELIAVLEELRGYPPNWTEDHDLVLTRQRGLPNVVERLSELIAGSESVRQATEDAMAILNGEVGDTRSFDGLHRLLEAQAYRLAFWRVSGEEINYRRFFDINDLVAIRMENPRVFADTHRLIRKLLANGDVTGLRLDHPDGLFNPLQYFVRAQMLYTASQCNGATPEGELAENGIEREIQSAFGQRDWGGPSAPLYLLVEKILEPGEHLPVEWPVDGTVGYDFANLVNGVLIDPAGEKPLTQLYHRVLERTVDIDDLIYDSKKLIMDTALASEINVLTHMLDDISGRDRRARDYTRNVLSDAIRETIACFPVYRTYIDERGNMNARDREQIDKAIVTAKRRNEGMAAGVFDFLRDILLLEGNDGGERIHGYRKMLYFTLKFQQLTGPVMAKGLEDTTFYVYNRFISLNEVGGSPETFGTSLLQFHRANAARAGTWAASMLSTSTHDTKRSEDVRARLNVLSEMPREWSTHVMRFRRVNKPKKLQLSDGRVPPDANEEYLLYQTLLGAWPLEGIGDPDCRESFVHRIQEYMTKAIHEAKVNLSWVNQNPDYTEALQEFVASILEPGSVRRPNQFLSYMDQLLPQVQFFGAINSLSQTLIKLTAPGVPDIYQGQEMWDFSLVDPDNRRPVDFEARKRAVSDLNHFADAESELCRTLLENWRDGHIKLWTVMQSLRLRQQERELFMEGSYTPLSASYLHEKHVIAYARTLNGRHAIAVAPRLSCTLMKGIVQPPIGRAWDRGYLEIPPEITGTFRNVFTGETVSIGREQRLLCSEIFRSFPVALLVSA